MKPLSTHTPATSAAMAVPTFRGTALLLIVDPFDHHTTSFFAIVLEAAVQ